MIKLEHIGQITKLGIPMMLGSILQILMNTMDMFFVSRLGTNYAAASAMGTSIAGVIFVFAMLISAGAIALIAQKKGQNNYEDIRKYSMTASILALTIGGVFSIIAVLNSSLIVSIYNPEVPIANLINQYVSIIFMFIFVVFLNTTLRSVVQASGDTKNPLYIFGVANLINIFLDYVLIVHFKWGIEGAALATVISQSFACVLMFRLIIKVFFDSSLSCFLGYVGIRVNEMVDILKIGIWACIQSIARPITGLLMMRIVYDAGQEVGSAAFGIGLTIVNYFFITLLGLSGAVTILVGQKKGAGKIHEAKHIVNEGILVSFINYGLFIIPFFIVPGVLFDLFDVTEVVKTIGVNYLRIVFISFIFLGTTFMYRGAFSGTGNTFPPMLSALFANVVIKVGLAYIFVAFFDFGLNGVWIAISVSVFVEFISITWFYKKGKLYKLC